MVTWKGIQSKGKKSVELGDLMICHFHSINNTMSCAQAIILQAKVARGNQHTVGRKELAQLDLYDQYHRFEYRRSPGLNGHPRQIAKASDHPLAYMLIESASHPHKPFRLAVPNVKLIGRQAMEIVIPRLLLGRSGRAVHLTNPSSNDDWSKVIKDLLTITYRSAYRLISQGKVAHPRGAGRFPPAFAQMVTANGQFGDVKSLTSFFGGMGINGGGEDAVAIVPPGGMGAILIRTIAREE